MWSPRQGKWERMKSRIVLLRRAMSPYVLDAASCAIGVMMLQFGFEDWRIMGLLEANHGQHPPEGDGVWILVLWEEKVWLDRASSEQAGSSTQPVPAIDLWRCQEDGTIETYLFSSVWFEAFHSAASVDGTIGTKGEHRCQAPGTGPCSFDKYHYRSDVLSQS